MLNKLEMLRIFCAAATAGSFKAAAVQLGISPQAVTRAVQKLERLQGEPLFHRNTRRVQITDFGESLARQAQLQIRQLDALFEPQLVGKNTELSGLVRITAPRVLGRQRLMPSLTRIAQQHPNIHIDLRLNDLLANVVDEKIDIGIRIGPIKDNRFVARKIAQIKFHIVATPALIAHWGAPQKIADLNTRPTTAMLDSNTGKLWPWLFAGGLHSSPLEPTFICDDTEVECDAVLAGLAFGQIPDILAAPHIAAGALQPVLEHLAPAPWDIYIYRPQQGPVPARIRLVFDELITTLRQLLPIAEENNQRR